jgi:hypothetical protein
MSGNATYQELRIISCYDCGDEAQMSNLRRATAGLVGIPLLLVTLTEAYFQSFGFYAEHYTFPMEKFGVRTPLRWQDIMFLAVFWPTAVALICVSYRLLKYAFRRQHPASGC